MLTPSQVLAFFLLSTLVLLGYWGWWAVLYCSRTETEASQEVTTTSFRSIKYIKNSPCVKRPFKGAFFFEYFEHFAKSL